MDNVRTYTPRTLWLAECTDGSKYFCDTLQKALGHAIYYTEKDEPEWSISVFKEII